MPFGVAWQDHQDARAWAKEALYERTTIAVDGSQISPTVDFFPPVGAIQIGWFVNEHCAGGRYEKELEFAVLSPDELRDQDDSDGDESYAVQTVNQVRFVRECRRLRLLMASTQSCRRTGALSVFSTVRLSSVLPGKISQPRGAEYIGAISRLAAGPGGGPAGTAGRLCGQLPQPRHRHDGVAPARPKGATCRSMTAICWPNTGLTGAIAAPSSSRRATTG